MLRGKTIEEIVNRWSAELETHVREFNRFAGEVAVWDRALIENGHNVSRDNIHVLLLTQLAGYSLLRCTVTFRLQSANKTISTNPWIILSNNKKNSHRR